MSFNSPAEMIGGSQYEITPYSRKSKNWLESMFQGGGLEGNKLFQGGTDFLQKLFGGDYSAFEQPLMEKFQQQTVPGLSNQFAGMGTGASGLNSSGFQNSLSQAGRGLTNDLAAQRSQLMMSMLQQALQYANAPNENRFRAAEAQSGQYYEVPGQEGLLQGMLKAWAGSGGGFGK